MRLWQGLGYYSRARNLHFTAKHVSNELNGKFPPTYSEIVKLKGVGPYTAAAIASICFDEAEPVVDGNVFRFASRYFGIEADISKSGSRKIFEEVLKKEIAKEQPGTFNQAMMEYGATTCSPSPGCEECGFSTDCYAYKYNRQKSLPVKTGKIKVRKRHFNYVVIRTGDNFFLKERTDKDVWSGLFDFYLIEGEFEKEDVLKKATDELSLRNAILDDITEPITHLLSHQKITATFYTFSILNKDSISLSQKTGLKMFSVEEMLNLPKPKLIVNYLSRLDIN